ncbi:hypothetical protein KEM54_003578 [Ascosphaera aggregata]|nr:hypothetical protein KEM54_003578 [Ascosphaera aggregata]
MREAMDKDSVLLIHDLVIPTVGVSTMESAIDLLLMASLAGKERTEAEWRALITSVGGLKIKKIWTHGDNNMSLFEVVRDI